MTNQPPERAVELNITQEQLDSDELESAMAVAPSQREEAIKGYDVSLKNLSRVDFQYKAVRSIPVATQPREYPIYEGSEKEKPESKIAVQFNFYPEQSEALSTGIPEGGAFYALPVVMYESGLGSTLDSTLFLDVQGLEELSKSKKHYTAFWVPLDLEPDTQEKIAETDSKENFYPDEGDVREWVNDIEFEPTFSEVYMKLHKDEHDDEHERVYDRIEGNYIYKWQDIEKMITEDGDDIGIPVRVDGEDEVTKLYDDVYDLKFSLREPEVKDELTIYHKVDNFSEFEDDIDELDIELDKRSRYITKHTDFYNLEDNIKSTDSDDDSRINNLINDCESVTDEKVTEDSLEEFACDVVKKIANTKREFSLDKERIKQTLRSNGKSDDSSRHNNDQPQNHNRHNNDQPQNDELVEIDYSALDPTEGDGSDRLKYNYFGFGENLEDDSFELRKIGGG